MLTILLCVRVYLLYIYCIGTVTIGKCDDSAGGRALSGSRSRGICAENIRKLCRHLYFLISIRRINVYYAGPFFSLIRLIYLFSLSNGPVFSLRGPWTVEKRTPRAVSGKKSSIVLDCAAYNLNKN